MADATNLHEGDICSSCQSVPWLELAREGEPGMIVRTFEESWDELRHSDCPLCCLISDIMPGTTLRSYPGTPLRLYSTKTALGLGEPKEYSTTDYTDGRCLSFSTAPTMDKWFDGYLVVSDPLRQPEFEIRPVNPFKVDIDSIQGCLTQCRQTHGSDCAIPVGSKPSNLRVINCQLLRPDVIMAPRECQYAALSYVWGSPQPSSKDEQSSEGFPRVVLDAIAATKLLGMRYLWVDRYCIDQGSESDKHHQIQQMGQVYSHAEVTLVAASGSNASCGLPGLGHANRPMRRRHEMCGVTFCEGPEHVSHLVRRAVWATRGWTFQESLLSRRRIIFTENEVTFLCNSMHCAESWKLPWDLTKRLPKDRLEGILPRWGTLVLLGMRL